MNSCSASSSKFFWSLTFFNYQRYTLPVKTFYMCVFFSLQKEYESYYFVKFQKYPKVTKKIYTDGKDIYMYLMLLGI